MEANKEIHKYFRLGDIVINDDVWGNKKFVIHGFGGNNYYPELYVHVYGKPKTITNTCNWDVRMTSLIDSAKRPLSKFKKTQLIKLLKTGSEKMREEIKREMIIRTNKKIYGII